jgi:hypothetical protein
MIAHPELPELAEQFFARFSRFESALKNSGFPKQEKNEGVSADWDKFAHEVSVADLFAHMKANRDTAYLINEPPKKRVMVNGHLDWRAAKSPVNMAELAGALKRVRNNLFHGDKQNSHLSRNAQLLNAGLAIMERMLEANDEVRQAYEFLQEIS